MHKELGPIDCWLTFGQTVRFVNLIIKDLHDFLVLVGILKSRKIGTKRATDYT